MDDNFKKPETESSNNQMQDFSTNNQQSTITDAASIATDQSTPEQDIQVQATQQLEAAPALIQEQPVFIPQSPEPKKSKTPIIIAIIGSLILLGGISFAAFMIFKPKNFAAIIDKDLNCTVEGPVTMNVEGKFSKDNKFNAKINFFVSAEISADYKVISTTEDITTIEVKNPKTKTTGLDGKIVEQNGSNGITNGKLKLDFKNFSKDKSFKITSEGQSGVGLSCKEK